MTASTAGTLQVEVAHLGPPLDDMTRETLERALAGDLARQVVLHDVALPAGELAPLTDDLAFVAHVAPLVNASRSLASVSVCVVQPPAPPISATRPKAQAPGDPLRPILLGLLDGHPRVSFTPGDTWQIQFVAGPCPTIERAPPPGQDRPAD